MNVFEVHPSVFIGSVTIGQSIFLSESTLDAEDARKKVSLDALMKTEYAFSNLPTELKHNFRPKSVFSKVVSFAFSSAGNKDFGVYQ